MTGIERIAKERKRQIEEEDWTPEHDEQHNRGELAQAAAFYAYPADTGLTPWERKMLFPDHWDDRYMKLTPKNRLRELEKAGALIAAEIDRIQAL